MITIEKKRIVKGNLDLKMAPSKTFVFFDASQPLFKLAYVIN